MPGQRIAKGGLVVQVEKEHCRPATIVPLVRKAKAAARACGGIVRLTLTGRSAPQEPLERGRWSFRRALWGNTLLGLSTLALGLPFVIAQRCGRGALAGRIRGLWFRLVLAACRVDIRWQGEVPRERPLLVVSNHVSLLEVAAFGLLLRDAVFVAKAEMGRWPLFGGLVRAAGTVCVERTAKASPGHCRELRELLQAGRCVVMFPEATTGDGLCVLPFRSSLLGALPFRGDGVGVQPVSIAYLTDRDGRQLGVESRRRFGWTGPVTLMEYLWVNLGFPGVILHLWFHAPIRSSDFADRKALAAYCESLARDTIAMLDEEARPSPGAALAAV